MALTIAFIILGGVGVVVARITNGRLAQRAGQHYSSLMNYITGLTGALIVFLLLGMPINPQMDVSKLSFIAYLGGALGLISIYLCNGLITKVSAIQFTLLLFLGQLFSGILIDYFLEGSFSMGKTLGGMLVMVGMVINVLADRNKKQENNKAAD